VLDAIKTLVEAIKLVDDLCSKHKITFINNSCIGKSLLNRSNLHLNRDGDKALGSSFCTYLKSDRISTSNTSNSNNHFFRPPSGRLKEWTMLYLNHACETHDETQARVDNMSSNNVSGDFLKTLSSIPNERGFKMAFLNTKKYR
jgi:hypothetical protein